MDDMCVVFVTFVELFLYSHGHGHGHGPTACTNVTAGAAARNIFSSFTIYETRVGHHVEYLASVIILTRLPDKFKPGAVKHSSV